MKDWTEKELVEWWEERAAVREFDGGMGRQRANFLAARELRDLFGFVPQSIANRISRVERVEKQRNLFDNHVSD